MLTKFFKTMTMNKLIVCLFFHLKYTTYIEHNFHYRTKQSDKKNVQKNTIIVSRGL